MHTFEELQNRFGETMNRTTIPGYCGSSTCFWERHPFVAFVILLVASSTAGLAQDASQPKNSPLRVHATHLLGFAGTPPNANGTLSIEADAVQFQKSGKPAVEVKVASIQDVFLGDQSKQVGGLPMTLGKAAVPFGGGRAVSLFAHKKYDTLTIEYVDTDGGFHGAIFEVKKGEGEPLRKEMVGKGAHVSNSEHGLMKKTAEVSSESK